MTEHPDRIIVALASMAAGATAGGAVSTTVLLLFRIIENATPGALSQDQQFIFVTTGLLLGLGAGTAGAFLLARPITELWQRGVTAVTALFGSVLLGAAAALADSIGGPVGLTVYAVLLAALSRKAAVNAIKAGSG